MKFPQLTALKQGCMAVIACLALTVCIPANAFYTVHKVDYVNLVTTFQVGLGDTHSTTVKKRDLLETMSVGKPDRQDIVAAAIDCNSPDTLHLIVWNMGTMSVVEGADIIDLRVIDTVVNSKKEKDIVLVLLDADALIGNGYITASMTFKELKNKLIPPDSAPGDNTFCMARLAGLSAAGYVDADAFGIVTGGRLKFGNPFTTIPDLQTPAN
jgi:hypothetical protein